MNISSPHIDALRRAVESPTNGFVGLVDDVLTLCRRYGLQLDWRGNCCRVRTVGNGHDEVIELPLRKSVFRAVLARVATLCDEQTPGTFEPYGGAGALALASNPNAVIGAAWMNTPDQQWLVVIPAAEAMESDLTPKIACRAYELWMKAGCPAGRDKLHWMQAAAESQAELIHSPKSMDDHHLPTESVADNVERSPVPSESNPAIINR